MYPIPDDHSNNIMLQQSLRFIESGKGIAVLCIFASRYPEGSLAASPIIRCEKLRIWPCRSHESLPFKLERVVHLSQP